MELKRVWGQCDNGLHIGEKGSEDGEIIRDESIFSEQELP